ncbi:hypothetical protein [Nitratifractor sp.]
MKKIRNTKIHILLASLTLGSGLLQARPISAPLAVFESTKIPHRTLKDGPSIFGTLPFFNESNASSEEKKEYKKMVKDLKKKKKENEKYRHSKAMQVFESTKIHRDPGAGPSPVREAFEQLFGGSGDTEAKAPIGQKSPKNK